MSCILLTGGFGYIGSHTATILSEKNLDFVIFDNFSNCKKSIIKRLEKITKKKLKYEIGDLRDKNKIVNLIKKYKVKLVIHFGALKSVEKSILNPIEYYENNVAGTINLLSAMRFTGVKKLLFSSTAAIYGEPEYNPIDENHPLKTLNPYGNKKLIIENILQDVFNLEKDWSILCLRYFNPVGPPFHRTIGTGQPSILRSSCRSPLAYGAILPYIPCHERSLRHGRDQFEGNRPVRRRAPKSRRDDARGACDGVRCARCRPLPRGPDV